ncbi:hypothetical protein C5167_007250 [Papaver somniferum]|nr:hypothetical protein C5167_007250 [Papaver somniferum]
MGRTMSKLCFARTVHWDYTRILMCLLPYWLPKHLQKMVNIILVGLGVASKKGIMSLNGLNMFAGKQKDLIKEKTWHKVASGTSEDNASSDMQFSIAFSVVTALVVIPFWNSFKAAQNLKHLNRFSKEASAMVLTRDNFITTVSAVAKG